jgi:hypothetical protein
VYEAKGSIGDAGGTATTLAVRASMLATADGSRAADGFPGIAETSGLTVVPVPTLQTGHALVFDASRCFFVLREPVSVDTWTDYHSVFDAFSIRVKGRAAVAMPAPDRAIRRLELGAGDG